MSNNKKISGLLDNVTGFATYIDVGDGDSINVKVSGLEIINGIYKISSTSGVENDRYTSYVQAYSGGDSSMFKIEFQTYGSQPCWTIDNKGHFLPSLVEDSPEHDIGSEINKVRRIKNHILTLLEKEI